MSQRNSIENFSNQGGTQSFFFSRLKREFSTSYIVFILLVYVRGEIKIFEVLTKQNKTCKSFTIT